MPRPPIEVVPATPIDDLCTNPRGPQEAKDASYRRMTVSHEDGRAETQEGRPGR
jgi:hypothetical protein